MDEQSQIRHDKLLSMQAAGNDPFSQTKWDKTHHSSQIIDGVSGEVSIAGRIVQQRIMGKASFVHILDEFGKAQVYVAGEAVGNYEAFCDWDLGDIIGVKGTVFKTKTGEVSVRASEVVLLSKCLSPIPDKHYGLKDPEIRYRERHLDMISNPEVREIFKTRIRAISAIREFFDAREYLEVETPVLQTIPGGTTAKPFLTHHNTLDMPMYLRIAVELFHKRLLVGGFERIYEIGRCFRNEGISHKHNPEFTMLEYYQTWADRAKMVEVLRELIQHVVQKTKGTLNLEYQGTSLDFSGKWKRMSMIEAVREVTGLDFTKLDEKSALSEVKKLKLPLPRTITWGTLLFTCFDELVEKTLIQPTFIYHFPVELAPLVKKCSHDPRLADMSELFINGMEMANTYTEINDPIDQRARFIAQMAEREKGDDEAMLMDEEFLSALTIGMPPTGGQGLGVDRLVMLLTNTHSIRETLLFPTMRPK
ncbi:MAG: lysine--tRNA ligase [Firmicutes bacterium]|nr:lysine--tRNA ligase [Bacillota bacterium]